MDKSYQVVDLCCTEGVDELDYGLDEEDDDHEVRHLDGGEILVARKKKKKENAASLSSCEASREGFFLRICFCCEATRTDR